MPNLPRHDTYTASLHVRIFELKEATMARVRLNEKQDLPEQYREMFERIEAQPGGVLNIYRASRTRPRRCGASWPLGASSWSTASSTRSSASWRSCAQGSSA